MKKILLFILLFITISNVKSQYFELKPIGFVDVNNNSKNYVTVEFNNTPQNDLYKKTLTAINSIYKSGKHVVSAVENESISIDGSEKKAINSRFNIEYKLIFHFKDGKIKIEEPYFNAYNDAKAPLKITRDGIVGFWIYNKNGEVHNDRNLESLNSFFNGIIQNIISNINKNLDW